MNLFQIRTQFDRIMRTVGDSTFQAYRDDFINEAWVKISELFAIPALKRTALIDAVADQDTYLFPYDYNGAEVFLYYTASTSPKRLDPVPEDVLALMYERRTGNKGSVDYYDWSGVAGSDIATRNCVLTNNSSTVLCAAAVAGDSGYWIRFDPFTDANGDTQDPGDYGYRITTVTAGVSYTLDRAYRGPASTLALPSVGRVRPAEQLQFKVYGNPSASKTEAFELEYYSRPRRLYNDADVPEHPQMGIPIAQMAMSVGYDFIHDDVSAKIWFGRATSRLSALKNRRHSSQALITDITVGSASGRRTGPPGIMSGYGR